MRITRAKKIALNNQEHFKESLAITKSGKQNEIEYKHILSDEDAINGANFYCYKNQLEWENLQKWAKNDKSKVNFTSNGLKNMLRSEHIAYNIFYPLEKLRENKPEQLCNLISKILNCKVNQVTEIKVEYAGNVHKSKLLKDNTSFDAYVGFVSKGLKCGAGIEIKYTEGSYPYGKTELENLENESSLYWQTAKASNMFVLNSENKKQLITKKLKQPWRNHLLGIKMVQSKLLDKFYSVHLFPKQNTYQQSVTEEYSNTLKDKSKQYFIPLTFEAFVDAANKVEIKDKWLTYFKIRY